MASHSRFDVLLDLGIDSSANIEAAGDEHFCAQCLITIAQRILDLWNDPVDDTWGDNLLRKGREGHFGRQRLSLRDNSRGEFANPLYWLTIFHHLVKDIVLSCQSQTAVIFTERGVIGDRALRQAG